MTQIDPARKAAYRLSPEHRNDILATIPAGILDSIAWQKLEEIFGGYLSMRARRSKYPLQQKRRQWQRLSAQCAKLTVQLGSFPAEHWRDEAIEALAIIEGKAKTHRAYHDTFGGFRGTRNENKEFLYWGVLQVWLTLGGRLTYTLAPDGGKVSGKAFDFFTACVKPLLGNETPIAGFADLIDRMRGKTDRELISDSRPWAVREAGVRAPRQKDSLPERRRWQRICAHAAKIIDQLRSFPAEQWRDEAIEALSIIESKAATRSALLARGKYTPRERCS
jgi:hypothetical protein